VSETYDKSIFLITTICGVVSFSSSWAWFYLTSYNVVCQSRERERERERERVCVAHIDVWVTAVSRRQVNLYAKNENSLFLSCVTISHFSIHVDSNPINAQDHLTSVEL
jgi:hypothetical protein